MTGIICTDPKYWEWRFTEFWIPTKEQVLDAEAEIERFLKKNPPADSPYLWEKLQDYKRQYVGYTYEGRKQIFCNFYCYNPYSNLGTEDSDSPPKPREVSPCEPMMAEDGGDCYFQVNYDVESRRVIRLAVNGEA